MLGQGALGVVPPAEGYARSAVALALEPRQTTVVVSVAGTTRARAAGTFPAFGQAATVTGVIARFFGGVAADAVSAEAALALVRSGARLTERLVAPADAIRAEGGADALRAARAARQATVRAATGEPAARRRRHAGAVPATGKGGLRAVGAGGRPAGDVAAGVGAARAALSGAGPLARALARTRRPPADRVADDRRADAFPPWDVAGLALARAGAVAAIAIPADARGAMPPGCAGSGRHGRADAGQTGQSTHQAGQRRFDEAAAGGSGCQTARQVIESLILH